MRQQSVSRCATSRYPMEPDRTDLLPVERRRTLHRAYLFRLATVTVVAGIGLLLVAAGLLLPAHALLSREIAAHEVQLATVASALSSTADTALTAQLAALESDLKTLSALSRTPKATDILTKALSVARPGVQLSGFVYAPPSGARAGTLDISGIASDRTSLQAYQAALQAAPFVASADLPVSAYAQASKIPFMITVTLQP